jgi:hypothetical protein
MTDRLQCTATAFRPARRGTIARRLLAALAAALVAAVLHAAPRPVEAARFSEMNPGSVPAGWHVEDFLGHPLAVFTLVRNGGEVVLEGRAEAAGSALARDLAVDPAGFPVLRWRWKVSRVVEGTDPARVAGDDYAVRLYVSFDYDVMRLPWTERTKLHVARKLFGDRVPTATICYVWDGGRPVGTITPDPYTDRVRTIVAEAGRARVAQWVTLERNVRDDFRAAFGEEAPRITAIAVSVDTDNTGESALSWFGDIEFAAE